ncbi:unnamed protein product [Mytilus coruscus]|uniref:Uncharacterized protein n=1 Tax=Mytilus coruscus TaxID=42192 RepID=A0A6J8BZR0_MYTCO|nr:unnamed protein product [Mytilus coruscus]
MNEQMREDNKPSNKNIEVKTLKYKINDNRVCDTHGSLQAIRNGVDVVEKVAIVILKNQVEHKVVLMFKKRIFLKNTFLPSTNEINKLNPERSNRFSIEHRRTHSSVDVQEEDFPEEYIPASTNEMHNIEDSSEHCEGTEVEQSSDVVEEPVAMSDVNTSSDWVEFKEIVPDAVNKDYIEDCEV